MYAQCLTFVVSFPHPIPVPREQVNSVTSFLDGSAVYGSGKELQHELREKLADGTPGFLMRLSPGDLLPRNPEENCNHRPGEFCFLAGEKWPSLSEPP